MKLKYFLYFAFLLGPIQGIKGQGCVAIRGFSSCAGTIGSGASLHKGEFLFGSNFRYFESFRHFRGREEETNRVAEGTEVRNDSYFLDLNLNYGISSRWYATLVIPFQYHKRSSMYEHGGNPPSGSGERHMTSSSGLGDIRVGTGYWFFDPGKHLRYNMAVGIGVKLPTGKYDYTDTFYNQGSQRDQTREAVVDQSIQPGDGGYGVALDLQAYRSLSSHFLLTTNLFYLLNPLETNGMKTRNESSEFSVPDQYAATLGLNYGTPIQGLGTYLGGRLEGIPSSDLIGESAGFRRPGYIISIEPAINYSLNKITLAFNVPIALERNRIQSYEDKKRTKERGEFVQGDAAFADYLINFNLTYRFGGKSRMPGFHFIEEKEK